MIRYMNMNGKSIVSIFLFFILSNVIWSQNQLVRCHHQEFTTESYERHPELIEQRSEIESASKEWIAANKNAIGRREVVTIPVVVHVVWNDPSQNISNLQVQSQIDALNTDFRKLNNNQNIIPTEFASLAADIEIEFCLASITPQGLASDGITRTKTDYENVGSDKSQNGTPRVFYDDFGGKNGWNPDQYINIWVASISGALGKACKPGECISSEDGLVIDPRVFGTTCNVINPYHLGRTATHEMGHFFDLYHIWGISEGDCIGGNEDLTPDFVDDTPNQNGNYNGCPSSPSISCQSNDMFMNFMDYVNDPCMALFTKGQKLRMQAALNGPRSALKNSNGCGLIRTSSEAVMLFPNPSDDCLHIDIDLSNIDLINTEIYNSAGKLILRKEINPDDIRSFDISNYPNGIYFIYFYVGKRNFVEKFIIHHN